MVRTSALTHAMEAVLAELGDSAQELNRADLNIHETLQIRANVANAFFRGRPLLGYTRNCLSSNSMSLFSKPSISLLMAE
jgi:hypothetical protein